MNTQRATNKNVPPANFFETDFNTFLAYHEQDWLDGCFLEYEQLYFRRYFGDIFVLFRSPNHLKRFKIYSNSCYVNTYKIGMI